MCHLWVGVYILTFYITFSLQNKKKRFLQTRYMKRKCFHFFLHIFHRRRVQFLTVIQQKKTFSFVLLCILFFPCNIFARAHTNTHTVSVRLTTSEKKVSLQSHSTSIQRHTSFCIYDIHCTRAHSSKQPHQLLCHMLAFIKHASLPPLCKLINK